MANIVPAILEKNLDEVQKKLAMFEDAVDLVQIDVADGEFVPNQLISRDELSNIRSAVNLEAHLMVIDPADWASYLDPGIFRRVFFHIEALPDADDLILELKERDIEPGLAINPDTPLDDLIEIAERVDSILFMGVNPGRQGQEFDVSVLGKIDDFINQFPDHLIALDGGIKESNIMDAVKIGVDNICVGSAIFRSEDPLESINNLNKIIK